MVCMATIQQKELRNHVGEVLRRVEGGESLTVTVAGRPVAELIPTQKERWLSGAALEKVWDREAPRGWDDDLAGFPGDLVDPFSE